MTENFYDPKHMTGMPDQNPIRDRLKGRPTADFSGATRRRLALMYRGRENK
ncbi:hypothetical protein R4Z09_11005 [Niallia oryzisoli]|uniref:Uncharacterized protein n=1 Tax=Niallia oryzisoli TaxID=1737571 RepID=A0ABZ2CIU4_9BACI